MPATATPKSAAQNTLARRQQKAATSNLKSTKTKINKEADVPATKTSTAKKTTTRKPAAKRTTAAKSTPLASVDVAMALTKMPAGKGGVRFDAPTKDLALTTVYVAQDTWKQLGEPESIVVTVAAAK